MQPAHLEYDFSNLTGKNAGVGPVAIEGNATATPAGVKSRNAKPSQDIWSESLRGTG